MRTNIALLVALASLPAAHAGLITFARTNPNPDENKHTGAGATYSRTAASTNGITNPVHSGASYTHPGPCQQPLCIGSANQFALASFDATTGTGRAYASTAFSPGFGQYARGVAEAGFTITDVLSIDHRVPFGITLNLSHGVPVTSSSTPFFSSAGLEYRLVLENGAYEVEMSIQLGQFQDDSGSGSDYLLTTFVNGEYLT